MSAIRESARDEDCQMRLPGVCSFDRAQTIWSHARWGAAGRGKAIKAADVNGCYACTSCDAVYDGNAKRPANLTQQDVDLAWCHGHFRSLLLLLKKGLIRV